MNEKKNVNTKTKKNFPPSSSFRINSAVIITIIFLGPLPKEKKATTQRRINKTEKKK
jgi:hypothetical protein